MHITVINTENYLELKCHMFVWCRVIKKTLFKYHVCMVEFEGLRLYIIRNILLAILKRLNIRGCQHYGESPRNSAFFDRWLHMHGIDISPWWYHKKHRTFKGFCRVKPDFATKHYKNCGILITWRLYASIGP